MVYSREYCICIFCKLGHTIVRCNYRDFYVLTLTTNHKVRVAISSIATLIPDLPEFYGTKTLVQLDSLSSCSYSFYNQKIKEKKSNRKRNRRNVQMKSMHYVGFSRRRSMFRVDLTSQNSSRASNSQIRKLTM